MKNKQSNRWFSSKQEQYVAKNGNIIEVKLIKLHGKKIKYRWLVECECCHCGKHFYHRWDEILRRGMKSCGCLLPKQHGMTGKRFYRIWQGMKTRCYYRNPKYNEHYKTYSAKGIKVCDRWLDFENFKEDMYESYLDHCKEFGEENTTLDRIDNDGNYEPSNCRWATYIIQRYNQPEHTFHMITMNGETHCLKEWCDILGKNYSTVKRRIYIRGWNEFDALTIGDGRTEKQRSD